MKTENEVHPHRYVICVHTGCLHMKTARKCGENETVGGFKVFIYFNVQYYSGIA